jgi:hypothetical protein
MKRITAIILSLCLVLCSCGKANVPVQRNNEVIPVENDSDNIEAGQTKRDDNPLESNHKPTTEVAVNPLSQDNSIKTIQLSDEIPKKTTKSNSADQTKENKIQPENNSADANVSNVPVKLTISLATETDTEKQSLGLIVMYGIGMVVLWLVATTNTKFRYHQIIQHKNGN